MDDLSVPILMYHSISVSSNPLFTEWAVPPEMFDAHVSYLVASGYTPITVTDLIRARTHGATTPLRPVVLTFDDAYADFYENAYPILRRHGALATLYAPTAYVGGACGWLRAEGESWRKLATWSQLAEMNANGIEVGGQSHTHVALDTLPAVAANLEIRRCKRLLEEHLGHPITTFAYPHGWASAQVKRLTQAAGYTSACANTNMRSVAGDDPFALSRLHVPGDMDVEALARLLAHATSPVEAMLRGAARSVIRFAPRSQAYLAQRRVQWRELPRSLPAPVAAAQPGNGFEPAAAIEIELGQPLSAIEGLARADGQAYQRALALVRLHSQPLGLVEIPLEASGAPVRAVAARVWDALGQAINAHLETDGLERIDEPAERGIPLVNAPRCLEARRAFLRDAPFVSVVIPTHNRPAQVMALIESVLNSTYPAERFELIVIDNAPSTNATALRVNGAYGDSPRVHYVREDHAGTSIARNRGLRLARGEIVIFVDDDALADRHWLAEMARAFDPSEDVACVTGYVTPMELETAPQDWFEQFGGYCKEGLSPRMFNLTNHRGTSPIYPFNIGSFGAGNCMAFRRATLMAMGGFDPALGPATPAMGGEDIDAMARVIFDGHTLHYQPAAIVRHASRREYRDLRKQMQGYGVGLAACLFKTMITRPRLLVDFIRKLPKGLGYAFGSESPRHTGKRADYPRALTWIELAGLLYGPLAYLRSARRARLVAARRRNGYAATRARLFGVPAPFSDTSHNLRTPTADAPGMRLRS